MVLAVEVLDKSIIDVTDLSIEESVDFFRDLPTKLNENELFIAKQVLKEINERLGFLKNVGLGYLSLVSCRQDSFRWGSATYPIGDADWQQPHGRPIHPR